MVASIAISRLVLSSTRSRVVCILIHALLQNLLLLLLE